MKWKCTYVRGTFINHKRSLVFIRWTELNEYIQKKSQDEGLQLRQREINSLWSLKLGSRVSILCSSMEIASFRRLRVILACWRDFLDASLLSFFSQVNRYFAFFVPICCLSCYSIFHLIHLLWRPLGPFLCLGCVTQPFTSWAPPFKVEEVFTGADVFFPFWGLHRMTLSNDGKMTELVPASNEDHHKLQWAACWQKFCSLT